MKIINKDSYGREYSSYTHEEYHMIGYDEAVGSSNLKDFDESPETLFYKERESKTAYLIGHATEDMLYEKVFDDGSFSKKFIVDDKNYSRPSDWEEIISCENPEEFIKINKDGTVSKASTNDWIKSYIDNGRRIPIKEQEFIDVSRIVNSLLRFKVKIFHHGKEYGGVNYEEIIGNSSIEEIIVWEDDNGLVKRCKPDNLTKVGDFLFLNDLKTFRDHPKYFNSQAISLKRWIQACHYREGVKAKYNCDVTIMHFTVVQKPKPSIPKILTWKDEHNYQSCENAYWELCSNFNKWVKGGKKLLNYDPEMGEIFIPEHKL